MAITHSPGLKAANLNAGFAPQFPQNSQLLIYSGAKPATADLAPVGTVLATFTLGAAPPFPAITSPTAVLTLAGVPIAVAASVTGTAGWFRLQTAVDGGSTNNTDKRLDGTVTGTGGGGDLTFDNPAFVAGQMINLTGFSYTHAA